MDSGAKFSRKRFLELAGLGVTGTMLPWSVNRERLPLAVAGAIQQAQEQGVEITDGDVRSFLKIVGLEFTDAEVTQALAAVRAQPRLLTQMRRDPITYLTVPPTPFQPWTEPLESESETEVTVDYTGVSKPSTDEDIAFLSIRELGALLRTKQISPVELTRLYLDRLTRYGQELLCVVNLTEELALKQAAQAEAELSRGDDRGPLHGIPYGLKDLFAVEGYPTTWGAAPFRDQVLHHNATTYDRLTEAGAILLAKLSLGALAEGDVWFEGRTKNPWNTAQGSSGSSAGSGCATAAALCAFTIGTETLGSIISPSFQCRVTGLRPTFGRTSRYGAMPVSWSMDKVGPMCRNIDDCALVFAAIIGSDPLDSTTVDRPFTWNPTASITDLRVGYLVGSNAPEDVPAFMEPVVALGIEPKRVTIPATPPGLDRILMCEGAAAFDDIVRDGRINEIENSNWPRNYRAARFFSAVDYLQAQRLRRQAMVAYQAATENFDVIVASNRGDSGLVLTNYTGHPQAIIPQGVTDSGAPRSLSFFGRLFGEEPILRLAKAVQDRGNFHRLRPDLSGIR